MACVFCEISKKKRKAWIVYENKDTIAFFDKASATRGHTLIVPKRHYRDIYDIPQNTIKELAATSKRIAMLYKKKLGVKAVDLAHASGNGSGQSIFHFHIHLIPRYRGDGIDEQSWWKSNYETKYKFDDVLRQIKG